MACARITPTAPRKRRERRLIFARHRTGRDGFTAVFIYFIHRGHAAPLGAMTPAFKEFFHGNTSNPYGFETALLAGADRHDQRRERMQAIVEDLLQLEFVSAYALWLLFSPGKQRTFWRSLEQDWLNFLELGPNLTELQKMPPNEDHLSLEVNDRTMTEEHRDIIREALLQGRAWESV